jgi:hypothetical protein
MTAEDKAIELYIKYIDAYNDRNLQVSDYKFAKQCALIAVNEIIAIGCIEVPYWQEVKTEIERL